jgi:hypothetical protein
VLGIGAGVVAIVVVAAIVVLAIGSPDVEEYPADSPEGTIQRYLRAVADGDEEAARALLSERVNDQMSDDPFGRLFCQPGEGHQVRVEDVDAGDQRATVTLEIENISGSGLDFDRYSYERQVALVFEEGGWKINEPYFCV